MPANIKLIEKRICKNVVYKGGAVNFNADSIMMINGKKAVREYIDHPGAVAVLPVLDDGRIIMVRQYRYPVGQPTWEIPAGKMAWGKDQPLRRARMELKEETGYKAAKITKLMSFWPCCAFSNELLHIYCATGLRPGRATPDDDEFLNVEAMPFEKLWTMLEKGAIKDSKTILALQAYKIHLLEGK